jgi:hypothetical protein
MPCSRMLGKSKLYWGSEGSSADAGATELAAFFVLARVPGATAVQPIDVTPAAVPATKQQSSYKRG